MLNETIGKSVDKVKSNFFKVMSSCLCKKAEGTVPPFVLLVVTIEDGIDDPVHAGDVHQANHRPSSSAHLDKAALDHVGGTLPGRRDDSAPGAAESASPEAGGSKAPPCR
jgi:hypothetical protein